MDEEEPEFIGYIGMGIWTLGSISLAFNALRSGMVHVYPFFLKTWIVGSSLLIIHILVQPEWDLPVLGSYCIDLLCALVVNNFNLE